MNLGSGDKAPIGTKPWVPRYLQPSRSNAKILEWLSRRLVEMRGTEPISFLARRARANESEILELESGTFGLSLGKIRDILSQGYNCNFETLLSQCNSELKGEARFEDEFNADCGFYFLRHKGRGREAPKTVFLMGGKPDQFAWAVPLMCLKGHSTHVDFVELAPSRMRNEEIGRVPQGAHHGSELIHVIYGTVDIRINGKFNRLKRGDAVHLSSTELHGVDNASIMSDALILVVRGH